MTFSIFSACLALLGLSLALGLIVAFVSCCGALSAGVQRLARRLSSKPAVASADEHPILRESQRLQALLGGRRRLLGVL